MTSIFTALEKEIGFSVTSIEFAKFMDTADPLKKFRSRFYIPKKKEVSSYTTPNENEEDDCIYLCGNSLGLQPKTASLYANEVLNSWKNNGVKSHFTGQFKAASCDQYGKEMTAELVGARYIHEVSLCNGLSVNVHLLLAAFYKPNKTGQYKIIIEGNAFPSDKYAIVSQLALHGIEEKVGLLEVIPRENEHTLHTQDIVALMEEHKGQIALLFFSAVHYYSGQKLDVPLITMAAKERNIIVGWDCAHAIGNTQLLLHDWNVDFAVWCSYKYLNSGAGGIAGIFLHDKYARDPPKHLHGWWSNDNSSRFQMNDSISLAIGADSFRISNPPPILAAINYASLEIFKEAKMDRILQKQKLLTGYLELLLKISFVNQFTIITPSETEERGSQLSLLFVSSVKEIHEKMEKAGIICDIRRGNLIRITPTPLYNSFEDVWNFNHILQQLLPHQP